LCGTTLMFVGLMLASRVSQLWQMYLTYGVINGVGFSLLWSAANVAVNRYFTTKRAMCSGMSVAGSGVGTLVLSNLSSALIHELGWRRALEMLAYMTAVGNVAAAFTFKPVDITPAPATTGGERPLSSMDACKGDATHDESWGGVGGEGVCKGAAGKANGREVEAQTSSVPKPKPYNLKLDTIVEVGNAHAREASGAGEEEVVDWGQTDTEAPRVTTITGITSSSTSCCFTSAGITSSKVLHIVTYIVN